MRVTEILIWRMHKDTDASSKFVKTTRNWRSVGAPSRRWRKMACFNSIISAFRVHKTQRTSFTSNASIKILWIFLTRKWWVLNLKSSYIYLIASLVRSDRMISASHVLRDTFPLILKIKDADHASRMPNATAEILPQSIKGTGEKAIRAIKYSYALKKKHACKIYL